MPNPIAGDLGETLVGGALNWLSAKNESRHQERLQREFAQNAIQWKVADATKAGVHPLYALGAPTMSYSPQSVGGQDAVGGMGQNISRALAAGMPREGQISAFDRAVQDLQLQKFGLENELLASQIARIKQEMLSKPALPPTLTLPGGGKFQTGKSTKSQVVQDEYGDVIEAIYGAGRLQWDAMDNYVAPMLDWFNARHKRWKDEGRYGKDGLLKNPHKQPGRR